MNAAKPIPSDRRRRASFARVLGASVGVGAIAGGVAAIFGALGVIPSPLAYAAAVLVAGVPGLWLSWRWWQAVDEAVREAHKTSWFWGGSTGMLVVGAIAMGLFGVTQGEAAAQFGVTRAEAGMILTGILLTVTLMLIGYGVCWAGWWLARSR